MSLLLVLGFGCGSDTCQYDEVEVADDAPLGEIPFTAADLLAEVLGAYTVTVTSDTGDSTATVGVTRGEGPAVFEDATFEQRLDADDVNPFFNEYSLHPPCTDRVRVPIVVAVADEVLGIDLTLTGTAAPPNSQVVPTDPSEVWISASAPLDALPAPPPDATQVYLVATFEDRVATELHLSWAIEQGGASTSKEILVFPTVSAE